MIERQTASFVTAITYPPDFAQPLQSGYALGLDRGTIETKMRSGWTRKRRIEPYTMRSLRLSFKMSVDEFQQWHSFVNRNAYRWITMDLQTDLGVGLANVKSELVRFTSAISFSYQDYAVVICSVDAEIYIDPNNAGLPPPPTKPPTIDDPNSGDTPTGDGDSASDPVGVIDMTSPPAQYSITLRNNTTVFSQSFRTKPSDEAFGRVTVSRASSSSSNTFRMWISQTASGGYLGYADGTGGSVSHAWTQGLAVGHMTKLNGGTRYFFNIQLTNPNSTGEELLVELY